MKFFKKLIVFLINKRVEVAHFTHFTLPTSLNYFNFEVHFTSELSTTYVFTTLISTKH